MSNTFPGSGNAGVGTTSPSSGLVVAQEGGNYTDGAYLLVDSSNSSFAAAAFAGIKVAAADGGNYQFLKLQNAGGTKFEIDGSGKVSIGGSAPSSGLVIKAEGANGTDGAYLLVDGSNSSFSGGAAIAGFKTAAADGGNYRFLKLQNAGGTKFEIDGSGKLSIGGSSPSSGLVVKAEGTNYTDGAYLLVDSSNSSFSAATVAGIKISTADGNYTLLRIQNASGTKFLIDGSGNVGIGVTPSAKLQVEGDTYLNGGQRVKVTTVSTTTTLGASHHTVIADTSTSDVTVNLPSASSHSGREYRIKNKNNKFAIVNGTIDGNTDWLRLKMNDAVTLVSDGTGWFII